MLFRFSNVFSKRRTSLKLTLPAVRLFEKSWDFVHPELVRPLAISRVHDIAVIARRLGMTWQLFNPEENIMRAEGGGHVLNSTYVRSVGVILRYSTLEQRSSWDVNALYIPTRNADAMVFGVIYNNNYELDRYKMKIGTLEHILGILQEMDPSGKAAQKAKDTNKVGGAPFGFSDIIPLVSPMMRWRGSSIIKLPVPADHCDGLLSHKEGMRIALHLETFFNHLYFFGDLSKLALRLTHYIIGFVIFHERLKTHISSKRHDPFDWKHWVFEQCELLRNTFPEWEGEDLANKSGNRGNLVFLDAVQTSWEETEKYFKSDRFPVPSMYAHLVASHLIHAVNFWGDATANVRKRKARYDPSWMLDWLAEGAHLYWDYLPDIISTFKKRESFYDELDDDFIEEAWIVMMFRGLCWWRCHWMDLAETRENSTVPKTRLPSRYWESQMPVYIG